MINHGMAEDRNLNAVRILLFVYKLKGKQRDRANQNFTAAAVIC